MRITQSFLLQQSLRQIRTNTTLRSRAAVEAATGLRIVDASDDPIGARRVMAIDSQLTDLDRYHRSVTSARTLLQSQDEALTSARDLLAQAASIARSVAGAAIGDSARTIAIAQIQKIRDAVMALGNTQVGSRYVFAGTNPGGAPPFTNMAPYSGDGGSIAVEIDSGLQLATTTPGEPVFGDALRALATLITNIGTADQTTINGQIVTTEASAHGMLQTQIEIGGRLSQAESADKRVAVTTSRLTTERDAVMTVDTATAGVRLTSAQSALERAYAVVARVMSTDLLNYLK